MHFSPIIWMFCLLTAIALSAKKGQIVRAVGTAARYWHHMINIKSLRTRVERDLIFARGAFPILEFKKVLDIFACVVPWGISRTSIAITGLGGKGFIGPWMFLIWMLLSIGASPEFAAFTHYLQVFGGIFAILLPNEFAILFFVPLVVFSPFVLVLFVRKLLNGTNFFPSFLPSLSKVRPPLIFVRVTGCLSGSIDLCAVVLAILSFASESLILVFLCVLLAAFLIGTPRYSLGLFWIGLSPFFTFSELFFSASHRVSPFSHALESGSWEAARGKAPFSEWVIKPLLSQTAV